MVYHLVRTRGAGQSESKNNYAHAAAARGSGARHSDFVSFLDFI
jgi:hypothetical protein